MKKFLILLMLVGMMVWHCADETTTSTDNAAVPLNYFSDTGTLQGTVFGATTGERLGGDSLSVTLVQGTQYRSPSVLKTDETDPFVGDYAFTDVPVTMNNPATYRITATRDNYQQFETYISFVTGAQATVDTEYNYVGNIYMFAVGETASDITIYVEYDNERVEGATVLLQQQIANNLVTTPTTPAATLFAANTGTTGTLGSLTGTTDSDGKVTFAGSALVLGGAYTPQVLPLTYEGVQLALTAGTQIIVGAAGSPSTQLIAMNDEEPGVQTDGLYIVYASNQDPQDVRSSGVLEIVFNRPIALVSEDAFRAVLANATTAVLNAATAGDEVTVTVSTDGLTLTLTPNWTTLPVLYDGTNAASADIGLTITYTGGAITLKDDDTANAIAILTGADGVLTIAGNNVGRVVNITGPQTDQSCEL